MLSKDSYSPESIDLLESAGIDFKTLHSNGTNASFFAENLIPSGLILNENVNWVMFHGVYDFAYLLKNVTNLPLPEEESLFMKTLEIYFPHFYDVRYLINNNNLHWMKGSLTKISNLMDIKRLGCTHQAGSDSLITSKLFFKLLETYNDQIDIIGDKNKIYGLNYGLFDDLDIKSTNSPPVNINYGNNSFKNNNTSYSPLSLQFNNECNFNNNGNRLQGNQNGFPRVNNVGNINNNYLNSNGLNQQNNLQQMMSNSNSPTKFNTMLPNQHSSIDRSNIINLQGLIKTNNNNGNNNLMYYPSQNGFNNTMTNNYNSSYNPNYNQMMNYGNGSFVGTNNNYMNQYYIQNGYKTNNNNIATL